MLCKKCGAKLPDTTAPICRCQAAVFVYEQSEEDRLRAKIADLRQENTNAYTRIKDLAFESTRKDERILKLEAVITDAIKKTGFDHDGATLDGCIQLIRTKLDSSTRELNEWRTIFNECYDGDPTPEAMGKLLEDVHLCLQRGVNIARDATKERDRLAEIVRQGTCSGEPPKRGEE